MDVSKWRVLIVDDEPDSIEVVRLVLTSAGATVYEAHNGQAALEILYRERPTLVLADLSMPVMDGWEMLKAIQTSEDSYHPPVIALTANAMVSDRERVLAAGFDGYLSKPLRMYTLLEDVTRCLEDVKRGSA